jgi:23S rRNA (pseudouridine1915-N3)-methyltransferase
MLLHIIARGRIARTPEAELVERYMKRISWPHKLTELPDAGGKMPVSAQSPARTMLLDETGEQLTSAQFADLLRRWRDDGVREVRFCLGAADGFTADERAGAHRIPSR